MCRECFDESIKENCKECGKRDLLEYNDLCKDCDIIKNGKPCANEQCNEKHTNERHGINMCANCYHESQKEICQDCGKKCFLTWKNPPTCEDCVIKAKTKLCSKCKKNTFTETDRCDECWKINCPHCGNPLSVLYNPYCD